MQEQIFLSLSQRDFETLIRNCVKSELQSQAPAPPPQTEEYLTVNEVCKILSISKVTCAKWRKEGRIPFYRIATRVRFKKSEVLDSITYK